MRMLLRISVPVDSGNLAIGEGRLQKLMAEQMERLKPEAAYFFPDGGQRAAMFVFDMKDSSEIAKIAEAFFTELDAEVDFCPVMNIDDLRKGLS